MCRAPSCRNSIPFVQQRVSTPRRRVSWWTFFNSNKVLVEPSCQQLMHKWTTPLQQAVDTGCTTGDIHAQSLQEIWRTKRRDSYNQFLPPQATPICMSSINSYSMSTRRTASDIKSVGTDILLMMTRPNRGTIFWSPLSCATETATSVRIAQSVYIINISRVYMYPAKHERG